MRVPFCRNVCACQCNTRLHVIPRNLKYHSDLYSKIKMNFTKFVTKMKTLKMLCIKMSINTKLLNRNQPLGLGLKRNSTD